MSTAHFDLHALAFPKTLPTPQCMMAWLPRVVLFSSCSAAILPISSLRTLLSCLLSYLNPFNGFPQTMAQPVRPPRLALLLLSFREERVIGKAGKKTGRREIIPGHSVPKMGKVLQKYLIDVITETEDGQTHPLSHQTALLWQRGS